MSTTINSLVLLGWKAELDVIKVPEKRFNQRTGAPEPDAMVFKHFSLKVGGLEIAHALDEWNIQVSGMDIHQFNDGRVFVGKTLSKLDDFGDLGYIEIDNTPDENMDLLAQVSGEKPRLIHTIYSS